MSTRKTLLNVAGITLGGIGILVCLASIIVLWMASARLGRVSESAFSKLDESLVAVRQSTVETRDRVREAKITTEDMEKSLREWTRREAGQRVALRLNVVEKADRVSAIMQQAGVWLDFAESSVGLVNEVLSNGPSTSEPADAPSLDQLIKEIASLRVQLTEAMNEVAKIRERLATGGDEKSSSERIEQAAQFALRVAATLGSMDSRLDGFGERLSAIQNRLQELNSKTRWWIALTTIGIALLILWLAAGQVALCRICWAGWRGT
jgi:hypothetical protein